ncbi:GGDEF domain-containing protein [Selenihalanaerobacter shriftii]|uniref:Diguanylate cyclase (GGDEF) domain-containing protein n=1 Tax=Selenihalanaerobacter shriftii TaxID=142842 RepID=A0A1T4LDW7_9FIRM|nr:GGDEF domain-containing protein [Selenihalanaerobacter shriftii]SJZ52768.1 diguanylate cyclase (GGDEF) domain-containing protein [Selenihalanaerobacter shriftii]
MKNFLQRYKYTIIAIVFVTILYSSFYSYQNTKQIIKDKYTTQQNLIEKSILNAINHADNSYRIAEKHLNEKMKKYSMIMIDKYRQNPNVLNWDLKKLKDKFDDYEIYIINSNLKVAKTTFKPDLGLNFQRFPAFSKLLKQRLKSDSFTSDRIDISINTGNIKKYSYIPTPDYKYLLELGVNIKNKFPSFKNLNVIAFADKLTKQYKSVKKIAFYKFNQDGSTLGKVNKVKKPVLNTNISEDTKKVIKEVISSNEIKTIISSSAKIKHTYKYIPYLTYKKNGELNWWSSYVIEVTYDNNIMLTELKEQRNLFLGNILIITCVFLTFIGIIIYLLKKSEHMAYYDHLTSLTNRKRFEEEFKKLIKNSDKNENKLAILFLDLDNFKNVNDTFGHDIGDKLLKEIANRLKNNLRKNDIVARLGGDEFTVLIPKVISYDDAAQTATKLVNILKKPIIINKNEFSIKTSIGISVYPEDGIEPQTLIKKADQAMYKAKKQKINYMLYTNISETKKFPG